MKLKYITFVFALISAACVFAQRKVEQIDPEKQAEKAAQQQQADRDKASGPKWYDNVSFGGNLGGGLGSGGAFFMVQPMAFYRITESTMAGLGISYYYWSQDYINSLNQKSTISDNAYGFNIFARQKLFDPVFVHAEYMPLNFKVYNQQSNEINREWVSSLYIGGGINQEISDRSAIYLVVLYDVLYDANRSFRGSPVDIRTGIYF
ncbi:MAG: hypothetical protein V4658_15505 [Bacteroidota bacterium]